jgi:hypothetical protein
MRRLSLGVAPLEEAEVSPATREGGGRKFLSADLAGDGACRRVLLPRPARHPWLLRACGTSADRIFLPPPSRVMLLVTLSFLLPLVSGCAVFGYRSKGVPIDQRPTPKQPAASDTVAVERIRVEPVVQANDRALLMAKVVADTAEAGAAVRRCSGRKLLPEQESTIESTLNFLREAKSALRLGELSRAEQGARKAKALAASLRCS